MVLRSLEQMYLPLTGPQAPSSPREEAVAGTKGDTAYKGPGTGLYCQALSLAFPIPLSPGPLSPDPSPILGSRFIGMHYLHRHETSPPGEIPPGDQASFLRSGHIIRRSTFLSSLLQPPAGVGPCYLAGGDPASQI